MALLEVKNVSKVYSKSKKNKGGSLTALDDVSFTLDKGEALGLIGPNGAGKSTLIKCITGLATQTSGEITINGYDTKKQRVKSIEKVGAIIESPDMYKDWTAMENLLYLADLSISKEEGLDKNGVKERVESLLKLVNLYDRRNDKVYKYSLGMKQRLGIAQALLSKPEVLILDEPANGLDPEGIKEIRDIIRHLAKDLDMAVLVSSHNLSELQLTCDRFLIIKKGKILADIKADDIVKGGTTVVIQVDDAVKAIDVLKSEYDITARHEGDGKLIADTEIATGDITKTLILNGVTVNGITVKENTLEETFLSVTEDKKKDTDKEFLSANGTAIPTEDFETGKEDK
ncbi:MAG: ABC transporter ATP-binding protein [Clostridiales bacterium]|nr:ABC transporter ATP-binding protein [Clostridiales bacterium]